MRFSHLGRSSLLTSIFVVPAFTFAPLRWTWRSHQHVFESYSSTKMNSFVPPLHAFELDLTSPLMAGSSTLVSTMAQAATPTNVPMDPIVEAEIFNDLAHVALDLTTLVGPGTVAIKAVTVAGRIFAIASDYIPDHAMLPEELMFQSCMLCFSVAGLAESLKRLAEANAAATTVRDKRCYDTIFRASGLTWMQYKMLAASTFEWIKVDPNVTMAFEPHTILWPYKGEVSVVQGGLTAQPVSGRSVHLFGDISFALDPFSKKDIEESPVDSMTVVAGSNGATVLCISTDRLSDIMKKDMQVANAIRSVLMRTMQERITHLLANESHDL